MKGADKSLTWIVIAALAALSAGGAVAQVSAEQPAEELIVEDIVAWVNDDIVRLSQLVESEQAVIARLIRDQQVTADEIESRIVELRESLMLQSIWDRLLAQQAERLFDVDGIKRDLVDQFMKTNELESREELDRLLREEVGMTRDELSERLFLDRIPMYVVETLVLPRLGVSEERAREYYEANIEAFSTPASVTFSELVLLSEDPAARAARKSEAQELVARTRSGGEFVELIREASEAPSKAIDGKIGPVDPADLIPEIGELVMRLEPGVVSDPVETDQGWHIVRVEQRQPATVEPFESVRDAVEDAVRRSMMDDEYQKFVGELWDQSTVEIRRAYLPRLPAPWNEKVKIRD